jgi:hypothetical protein
MSSDGVEAEKAERAETVRKTVTNLQSMVMILFCKAGPGGFIAER